jgi:hypothetical protein
VPLEVAYAFNDTGASVVPDLSGNGRDLDLTGSAGVQVDGGRQGAALGKTGAAMPVLPASVLAASETADRTLVFDAQGGLGTWWVRWESDTLNSGTWGVLNLSGSMAVQARRDNGNLAERPVATGPEAGVFHNYAAVYEQATGLIQIFRDGALADETSFLGGAGVPLFAGADRINLAEWSSTGPALDNLRIYSHALTAAEIADIAGTPVESASGTAQLGVPVPIPVFEGGATAHAAALLAASLPVPVLDASATARARADIAIAVPVPAVGIDASARADADLTGSVPTPTLVASATARADADLQVPLPLPTFAAAGTSHAVAELRVEIAPPLAGAPPTSVVDLDVIASLAAQRRIGAALLPRAASAELARPGRVLARLGAQ